jgi:hypothetical protein
MRASRYKSYRNGGYGLIPQLLQHGISDPMGVVAGVAQVVISVPVLRSGDTFVYSRETLTGTPGHLSQDASGFTPGSPGSVVVSSSNIADESNIAWCVITDAV